MRAAAFFRHWTLKEACVKTLGTGLATDIRAVRCHFDAEGGGFLFRYPPSAYSAIPAMSAWQFHPSPAATVTLTAASDPAGAAFGVRVLRVLPGLRVQPMNISAAQGTGQVSA